MFYRRKESAGLAGVKHDGKVPVIRASICTGEKVAGFQDPKSGAFEDVMLIRDYNDMKEFLREYRLREEDVKTIY